MRSSDLIIYGAAQLLSYSSPGGPKRGRSMRDVEIIKDGAAAVIDGRIAKIGISGEIFREFESKNVIDAAGCTVLPGFVDSHTHVVFAGDRLSEFESRIAGSDYLAILAAGGGIHSTVRHTRAAGNSTLVGEALSRLDKMLACGTTTAEIKTGYGLDFESEQKMLEVIASLASHHPIAVVPTFLAAHAIPQEFAGKADEYAELICNKMLPAAWDWYKRSKFYAEKKPFFADVFTEKNAFDLRQSRYILETAKTLGFQIKAHTDEFSNLGGSRLAMSLGAVSIDHLDHISDSEIEMLANSDTVAVITPGVNFNLAANRFADARKLVDAGCAIALATDYNPGSAPCPSMPMTMAIACRYQKLLPAEALAAATINAAYAVGLQASRGSLETGKQADIAVFRCKDYREIAYEFGAARAERVFIAGKQVWPRA